MNRNWLGSVTCCAFCLQSYVGHLCTGAFSWFQPCDSGFEDTVDPLQLWGGCHKSLTSDLPEGGLNKKENLPTGTNNVSQRNNHIWHVYVLTTLTELVKMSIPSHWMMRVCFDFCANNKIICSSTQLVISFRCTLLKYIYNSSSILTLEQCVCIHKTVDF